MLSRLFRNAETVSELPKGQSVGTAASMEVAKRPEQGSLLDLMTDEAAPLRSGTVAVPTSKESFLKTINRVERQALREAEELSAKRQADLIDRIQNDLTETAQLMADCKKQLQVPLDNQLDMMSERLLLLQQKESSIEPLLPSSTVTPEDEAEIETETDEAASHEDFSPLEIERSNLEESNPIANKRARPLKFGSTVGAVNLILFLGFAGSFMAALFALSSPSSVMQIAEVTIDKLNPAALDTLSTGSIGASAKTGLFSFIFETMTWQKFVALGGLAGLLCGALFVGFWAIGRVILGLFSFELAEMAKAEKPRGAGYYTQWSADR